MIGVEVRVTGLKELETKMTKLRRSDPGMKICGELARTTVQVMKHLAPYWSGALMKSIQSRQTKDGYNIYMLEYGQYMETGTRPYRLPYYAPRFYGWTAGHGLNWFTMRRHIAEHGIAAHPFVQPAIDAMEASFPTTAVTVMNKTLKESGFR